MIKKIKKFKTKMYDISVEQSAYKLEYLINNQVNNQTDKQVLIKVWHQVHSQVRSQVCNCLWLKIKFNVWAEML